MARIGSLAALPCSSLVRGNYEGTTKAPARIAQGWTNEPRRSERASKKQPTGKPDNRASSQLETQPVCFGRMSLPVAPGVNFAHERGPTAMPPERSRGIQLMTLRVSGLQKVSHHPDRSARPLISAQPGSFRSFSKMESRCMNSSLRTTAWETSTTSRFFSTVTGCE
jgi:hypothetical protein